MVLTGNLNITVMASKSMERNKIITFVKFSGNKFEFDNAIQCNLINVSVLVFINVKKGVVNL